MYNRNTVSVVVPAYNEEGFVGNVIETIPSFVDRIYVIDDRSTDGTWQEITTTAARVNNARPSESFDQRVVAIRHDVNRGVGGAIKTGYQRARADRIDVTVVMGGDGQMDPAHLSRIIEPVVSGDAAYAKGNRLVNPADHEQMPTHRRIGNGILSLLTKIATGYWRISDPQMGYTAISLEALDTVDIDGMYEFYGYCNDLLVRLSVANLPVVDVPSPLDYGDETSHITYRTYIPNVSGMLLRVFLWRLWRTRHSGVGTATLVLFVGGAAGVISGVARSVSPSRDGIGDRLAAGRAMLGGIALLLAGMSLDAGRNHAQNWRENVPLAAIDGNGEPAGQPDEPVTSEAPIDGEGSADTT
ncbi:MAG: glycosyltransferase family 2 protein, partial [Halobacteriota archaeon]